MGGLGRYDSSSLQVFLNELLAGLKLSRMEQVDFGNAGGEHWLEANCVIIMAMWW